MVVPWSQFYVSNWKCFPASSGWVHYANDQFRAEIVHVQKLSTSKVVLAVIFFKILIKRQILTIMVWVIIFSYSHIIVRSWPTPFPLWAERGHHVKLHNVSVKTMVTLKSSGRRDICTKHTLGRIGFQLSRSRYRYRRRSVNFLWIRNS